MTTGTSCWIQTASGLAHGSSAGLHCLAGAHRSGHTRLSAGMHRPARSTGRTVRCTLVLRMAILAAAILMLAPLSRSASGNEAVSFQRDIVPLLKSRCAACHLTGDEPGNMALHPGAAYKTLVGVPSIESRLLRVKPGAPNESYIVRKLEGTHLEAGGTGLRMPIEGAPLSEAEIQRVRDWIKNGARKD